MNSEFYTAASGLLVEERRLELIANNLANASTPGYRAQRAFASVFQRFGSEASEAVRAANAGVALAGTYEVPGPGPVKATGRDLDLFLENDALLAVNTPAGRRYTRAGALQVSPGGQLSDSSGRPILGENGKPIGGLGSDSAVTPDGRVTAGENEVGRLLVVRDPKRLLQREGNNLLTADGNDAALETVTKPSIRTGWLEGSGTDSIGELVQLIEAQRAFETYQKLVSTTMNEVNKKAVSDIAG